MTFAESAVKISLPEKLTPYLKSSRKKDGMYIPFYITSHTQREREMLILFYN